MDRKLSTPNQRTRELVAVLGLGLLVRAAVVTALGGSLVSDPDAYRKLAENLRLSGVYTTTEAPTAFRPPLYPLLLSMTAVHGEVGCAAVGTLHVLFGGLTVWFTFLLAEACRLKRGAFLAAALVAVDPILLNQSAFVMTETLATLLAAAGMLALTRVVDRRTTARAAVAGVLLGLSALCRPTFLPWLGIAGLLLSIPSAIAACSGPAAKQRPAPAWQLDLRSTTIYFVAAALTIAPWAIRNLVVLGEPKLTTTHGGYTVLLGNNPSFYQYLRERRPGETWDATPLANAWQRRHASSSVEDPMWTLLRMEERVRKARGTDDAEASIARDRPNLRSEFDDDAFAYSLAWRSIRAEPEMFAYACFVRVGRLWQLSPYPRGVDESAAQTALRLLTGAWYTGLLLLAACGVIFRRQEVLRSPLVWGVVLCVTFTSVHAVYWSNMRMRAPLMPMVCLLASVACVEIWKRSLRRKL